MAELRRLPTLCVLGLSMAAAIALFSSSPPALAQESAAAPGTELVASVRVTGNRTIPMTEILRHIRTRAGRPLDLDTLEEDVRRLNRTGDFVDVKTYTQQAPGGRIVVFELFERPAIQYVRYVGNRKVPERTLKKEIDVKVGDAQDPFALEEARSKLERFYQGRGYSGARVELAEGGKPDDRGAVFVIHEGLKQKVLWVDFVGNTIASDSRLRTQIKSKPPTLYVFGGDLETEKLDEDVKRLTAYYRGLGFFRARVGRYVNYDPQRKWHTVTFVIDEGQRFTVRDVAIEGATKFSSEQLQADMALKAGQFFDQSDMQHDLATLQDKYGSIGYVFADIQPESRYDDKSGSLDLVYHIDEGDRFRVGRIDVEIKGEYPHTRITTVLNRLSLKPGDIVDVRELRASERRLRASGLFLVDPVGNRSPKIVFSPPELDAEAEQELAREPRSVPRGQSPDPAGPRAWLSRRVPCGDDRTVNLRLEGEATPEGAEPRLPQQQPQEQQDAESDRSWLLRRWFGGGAAKSSPPAATATVIRGQNYDPNGGTAVPQFTPSGPNYARVPQPGYAATNVPTQTPAAPAYNTSQPTAPATPYAAAGSPAGATYPTPTSPGPTAAASGGYQAAQPAPAYGSPSPTAPYVPSPPPPSAEPSPLTPVQGGLFRPTSPFIAGPGDQELTRPLPLRVVAEETQTGRLMFGVGINSDAGLVGSVIVDEQNFDWRRVPRSWADVRNATAFRGAGQRLRLEAVPGTEVQRYMASFQEPYLFDTNVSLGLSAYFYDRDYTEWDEERIGGRVSLGYQFTHDLSGSLAFRGARINIHDVIDDTVEPLAEVKGDNYLYGFSGSLTHDTRDNAFLATEGHLLQLSLEQVIGSYDYPRFEAELQKYYLMHERPDGSGRHVLQLKSRFAWTGDDTPIYDHYFAGGFSTIRGFDYRGVSPRMNGIAIGGHALLLNSVQYVFPITADDMVRGVVFLDTGTVEPNLDNWNDKYRLSPGFGLRITIPAMGPAPIALDFAFPIRTNTGDEEQVFAFFVGMNR